MIQDPALRSLTHGRHFVTTTKSLTSLLLLVAGVVDSVAVAVVDVVAFVDADVQDAVEVKSQVSLLDRKSVV